MFEEEGQLELPFPSVGESPYHTATSPGLSSEASPPHCLENASRQANDAYGNGQRGQARKPRLARRRPNPEDEAALPLPPHRTARNLVFENTRRAAEEASMHRYRQDAQARSSAKSWEPEGFDLRNSPRSGRDDAEDAGYAPGKASIGHPRRPVLPRGHRRPSDPAPKLTMCSLWSLKVPQLSTMAPTPLVRHTQAAQVRVKKMPTTTGPCDNAWVRQAPDGKWHCGVDEGRASLTSHPPP